MMEEADIKGKQCSLIGGGIEMQEKKTPTLRNVNHCRSIS